MATEAFFLVTGGGFAEDPSWSSDATAATRAFDDLFDVVVVVVGVVAEDALLRAVFLALPWAAASTGCGLVAAFLALAPFGGTN